MIFYIIFDYNAKVKRDMIQHLCKIVKFLYVEIKLAKECMIKNRIYKLIYNLEFIIILFLVLLAIFYVNISVKLYLLS